MTLYSVEKEDTQVLVVRTWGGIMFIAAPLGSDDDGLYVQNPLQIIYQGNNIGLTPLFGSGVKNPDDFIMKEFRVPHAQIMWMLEATEDMAEAYQNALVKKENNIIVTDKMPL